MDMSDRELIEAYANGTHAAFDVLVRRYLKLVYTVAFHFVKSAEDAEDIAQDVFVNVMRNIKSFDLDRPFKPWILQIARNRSLDWLKAKRPVAFSSVQDSGDGNWLEELADASLSPSEIAAQRLEAEQLKQAIATLPASHQNILSLRYIKQLTFREIGEELGELMDTVKTKHRRALGVLKKKLHSAN